MDPPDKLPADERCLQGFDWKEALRPHAAMEVFGPAVPSGTEAIPATEPAGTVEKKALSD